MMITVEQRQVGLRFVVLMILNEREKVHILAGIKRGDELNRFGQSSPFSLYKVHVVHTSSDNAPNSRFTPCAVFPTNQQSHWSHCTTVDRVYT